MKRLIIHEVGPRDGLQVETRIVPTDKKIEWIGRLAESGVDIIQLGSFVNQAKVPQMADTDSLFRVINEVGRKPNVTYSGLVLNEKGLERALACGVDLICMGASASDTHSRKNTGMSTEEAASRITLMAKAAMSAGKDVQASVQSAFGCGFEGVVHKDRVLDIVKRYLDAGARKISLADTAGHANPWQVEDMFGAIFALDPAVECTCHFHDTYGMALANCYAAMDVGVSEFESAFAGLGGCPFTKLSGGNVATEDLVHMLQRIGIRTDIKLDHLIAIANDADAFFGRELDGRIHRTGPIPTVEQARVN